MAATDNKNNNAVDGHGFCGSRFVFEINSFLCFIISRAQVAKSFLLKNN